MERLSISVLFINDMRKDKVQKARQLKCGAFDAIINKIVIWVLKGFSWQFVRNGKKEHQQEKRNRRHHHHRAGCFCCNHDLHEYRQRLWQYDCGRCFGMCGAIGYVVPVILGVIGVLVYCGAKKAPNAGKLILLGFGCIFFFRLHS